MGWQEIPGWSSDIEPFYEQLATSLPQGGTFVEVGVLFGRSLSCIGTLRPDLDLWGVDTWQGSAEATEAMSGSVINAFNNAFLGFVEMMSKFAPDILGRLHVLRAPSTAIGIEADAVFIDAAHDLESVRADIKHWLPYVKPGGIIAGHDYQPDYPGVRQAVDEAFGMPTLGPGAWSSVWWVQL
jgi:hypothetical protein